MKRKYQIAAGVLLLGIAVFFVVATCHERAADELLPTGGAVNDLQRPDRSTSHPPRMEAKEIAFPGLAPLPFTSRKSMGIGELGVPFEPLSDKRLDLPEGCLDLMKRNQVELLTDDAGNLITLFRNRGMIDTMPRLEDGLARLKDQGATITRLGNDCSNIKNEMFVRGLLHYLYSYGSLDHPVEHIDSPRIVRYAELEMVPVTFVLSEADRGRLPKNQAIPGMLIKKKLPVPGDPTLGMNWREDFPPEEARQVDWSLVPINLTPKNGQVCEVLDGEQALGPPGYFYERIVHRPGDPPVPPLSDPVPTSGNAPPR